MKKILALCLLVLVSACATAPQATKFPYGMTEREWNELSVRDQTLIRRDYTFYRAGNMELVAPTINIEGRRPEPSRHAPKAAPAATKN